MRVVRLARVVRDLRCDAPAIGVDHADLSVLRTDESEGERGGWRWCDARVDDIVAGSAGGSEDVQLYTQAESIKTELEPLLLSSMFYVE